jgi:hypothetical protein
MGVLDDAIREHLDLKRRHGVAEEELRRQEEEALGPARREVAPAETDDGDGTGDAAPAEVEAAETALAEQDELTAAEAEPHDPHGDVPELSEALPASAVRSDLPEDEQTGLYELAPEEADPEGLHEEPLQVAPHEEQLHEEPLHDEPPREEPLDREPPHRDPLRDERLRGEEPPHAESPHAEAALADDEPVRAGDTPPRGFEPVEDDDLFDDEDELPHADEVSRAGEVADDDEELGPDEAADGDLLEDTPDFLQETPEHDRLWFEQKPPRDFDFD